MNQSVSVANLYPRDTGWEGGIVVLLALALLAAGWLDVRSYLAHRTRPRPDFALLDPGSGTALGMDELYRRRDSFVLLHNVGGLENDGKERFRQALGPRSLLLLSTTHPHARLDVTYANGVAGQNIAVRCNDQTVEQLCQPSPGLIVRRYPLALRPGWNQVTFDFTRYGGSGQDTRPMAGGTFVKLELTLD